MKLSPLQLEAYFLTESSFRANQDFDPKKPVSFHDADIVITPDIQPIKDQNRRWQVVLNIKLQPRAEANSPYVFAFTLVGIVWAAPEFPEDKLAPLVATNGSSMLYGVAREIVRDLTARGPFPALSLPSVSFIPDAPQPTPAASPALATSDPVAAATTK